MNAISKQRKPFQPALADQVAALGTGIALDGDTVPQQTVISCICQEQCTRTEIRYGNYQIEMVSLRE